MSELSNKQNLGLHLGAGAADGYLIEGNAVLDTTRDQSVQDTIDYLYEHGGGGGGNKEIEDFVYHKLAGEQSASGIYSSSINVIPGIGAIVTFKFRVDESRSFQPILSFYNVNDPDNPELFLQNIEWCKVEGRLDSSELEAKTFYIEEGERTPVLHGEGSIEWYIDFRKQPDLDDFTVNKIRIDIIPEAIEAHIAEEKRTFIQSKLRQEIDPQYILVLNDIIPENKKTHPEDDDNYQFPIEMITLPGVTAYSDELNQNIKFYISRKDYEVVTVTNVGIISFGTFHPFISFKKKGDSSYVTTMQSFQVPVGEIEFCFKNEPYFGNSSSDKRPIPIGSTKPYQFIFEFNSSTIRFNISQKVEGPIGNETLAINEIYKALTIQ